MTGYLEFLLLSLVSVVLGFEDPTLLRLDKGWVRGNRHSVLGAAIGKEEELWIRDRPLLR